MGGVRLPVVLIVRRGLAFLYYFLVLIFLDEWLKNDNFQPPNSDMSLSPEVNEMMHTEGDFIDAKNYTVNLAHFFSHLGNFRRPVDPALC